MADPRFRELTEEELVATEPGAAPAPEAAAPSAEGGGRFRELTPEELRATAPPAPPPGGAVPDELAALGRGASQGATLGFGDEAISGLGALHSLFGGGYQGPRATARGMGAPIDTRSDYQRMLDEERRQNALAAEAHPVAYYGGEALGTVGTAGGTGAGAVKAATKLAPKAMARIAAALGSADAAIGARAAGAAGRVLRPELAQALGRGVTKTGLASLAAGGGVAGGVEGAGRTEHDLLSREGLSDVGTGLVAGAGTAPLAGLVTRGGLELGRKVLSPLEALATKLRGGPRPSQLPPPPAPSRPPPDYAAAELDLDVPAPVRPAPLPEPPTKGQRYAEAELDFAGPPPAPSAAPAAPAPVPEPPPAAVAPEPPVQRGPKGPRRPSARRIAPEFMPSAEGPATIPAPPPSTPPGPSTMPVPAPSTPPGPATMPVPRGPSTVPVPPPSTPPPLPRRPQPQPEVGDLDFEPPLPPRPTTIPPPAPSAPPPAAAAPAPAPRGPGPLAWPVPSRRLPESIAPQALAEVERGLTERGGNALEALSLGRDALTVGRDVFAGRPISAALGAKRLLEQMRPTTPGAQTAARLVDAAPWLYGRSAPALQQAATQGARQLAVEHYLRSAEDPQVMAADKAVSGSR